METLINQFLTVIDFSKSKYSYDTYKGMIICFELTCLPYLGIKS